MKYARRAMFRQYRKAGIPFMVSHRLAKLGVRYASPLAYHDELAKEKYKVEVRTYCECCGPTTIELTSPAGKKFHLNLFNRLPE